MVAFSNGGWVRVPFQGSIGDALRHHAIGPRRSRVQVGVRASCWACAGATSTGPNGASRCATRCSAWTAAGGWGDPKTASGQRAIDLTAPTLDLLRTHRARTAERMLAVGHALSDDDLVSCDDAGQPLWGRHVTTRQLKPLLGDAGLPPIRFDDLRHTFATLQLAAGTNPKIVSEVLGHKEVAITLDRYSHALPTLQAKAMARLDSVLGRAPRRRSARSADTVEAGGSGPDRGPDKGPNRRAAGAQAPDPSVDQAENGEIGTAYRMRGISVSCVSTWVD